MTWVALVGPEIEEDLSLRDLASALARAGYRSGRVLFGASSELAPALAAILGAAEAPAVVGLSLDCPRRVPLALSLALALRQHGYTGHIAAGGRIATSMSTELLRDASELDSVLRWDGLVALLSALEQGRPLRGIPGLMSRAGRRAAQHAPDQLAARMVQRKQRDGSEIFVFRDADLFVPGKRRNLARLHALADALERAAVGRFATVISARPAAVDRQVFRLLRDRLHAIRIDLDVGEDQSWSGPRRSQRAIEIVRELDLCCSLNVSLFEPDSSLHELEPKLALMQQACDFPFTFRQQDAHAPRDPQIARVFQLAHATFRQRDLLVARVLRTRLELDLCRHFEPARHERSWRAEGIALTRALGEDSLRALRCLLRHADDARVVGGLARGMRELEAHIDVALAKLADRVTSVWEPFLGDHMVQRADVALVGCAHRSS
jgi:hypothetical protein